MNQSRYTLMILTSHAQLGETGHKTGFWLEEFVKPYTLFKKNGLEPIVVSIGGGEAPIDPNSIVEDTLDEECRIFLGDPENMLVIANTVQLDSLKLDGSISGVFLVGGHGTMWDFYPNQNIGRLIDYCIEASIPVGAVCHGVAGLLNYAEPGEGEKLKGIEMTGFSNQEETMAQADSIVPFLLESELEKRKVRYSSGQPFTPHVVSDGLFVTGQNPQSSALVAEKFIESVLCKK